MKRTGRAVFLFALTVFAVSARVYSGDLADLQKGVTDFSEDMAKSLPFNSSLGLNWSDAYIGKLIPSIPPHFGVGGSFGFTTLDLDSIEKVAGVLGYSVPPGGDRLYLPAYAAEARIGGLFLPFDVGVKFGKLPAIELWGSSTKVEYTMFGADFRWALLDGKSSLFLPNVSIGVGFNYLSGAIGGSFGSSSIEAGDNTITISGKKEIGFLWNTKSLDFKAQISKSILIITPYLGIGAGYAWSEAGYEVKGNINYGLGGKDGIVNYLKTNGLESMDLNASGFSSMVSGNAFCLRAFGGLSFNLMIVRLDLTGMYNFLDQNYGASLGLRVQI